MIGGGKQILHFVISVNHVLFSMVNLLSQFAYLSILSLDICVEILCFVLCCLYNSYNLVKVSVLIFENVFLKFEDLSVVEVTCLVKFVVLTTGVACFILCSCKGSLTVLYPSVFLCQLSINHFLDFLDKFDAACKLFFTETIKPMGLSLVLVHQLVKVHHICL